ncbi:MAG: phenylalanine--tRNA ligase subunit beta [bacterium]
MLISFGWLKEFVTVTKSPQQTADMLTMAGLEVESVREEQGDTVLDISLTPNRGDCQSVIGIARELSAITGKKIKHPKIQLPNEDPRAYIKVRIEDRNLCWRYAGRVIKGIKVGESPEWLKKRLEISGIRSINNIVDVTNYVMLELGQPLHAFDYEKLKARQIRVGVPPKSMRFPALDGTERQITTDTLMIWDGEHPSAIAGIMGGRESEVDQDTKSIFLESACFDPLSIRKSSFRLGLRTESSLRFERGIDVLNVDRALDRASYLVSELAGGLLCKKVDAFPRKYTPRLIKLNHETVEDLLGIPIPNTRVHDLLLRIGAQVEESFQSYLVEAPSWRNDLERDVDLIEEIARLHGYPKIVPTAPLAQVAARPPETRRKRIHAAKESMIQRGYSEVINFSFMNTDTLALLKIKEHDPRSRVVPVMNPLRQEESCMRTTLIPALLANLTHNYNRGVKTIKLFETANVCLPKTGQEKLPLENLRIGGLCITEKLHQLWKTDTEDFHVVKGDVAAMMNTLMVPGGAWKRSAEPFLHTGKSADLFFKDKKAGFVGVLSPEIVPSLGIKVQKADIVLFELDLDLLLSLSSGQKTFEKLSVYPYIQRDISILVDAGKTAQEVLKILKSFKSDLIDTVKLFDYYRGKNIPEGKASLAFTITYRSFERTLSEEEIEKVHKKLVEHLIEQSGAELRA